MMMIQNDARNINNRSDGRNQYTRTKKSSNPDRILTVCFEIRADSRSKRPLKNYIPLEPEIADEPHQMKPISDSIPWMRNMVEPHHPWWYRTIWLLLSVSVFLYCCYQLIRNLDRYLRENKTFRSEILVNDSVYFPAITICFHRLLGSKELRQQYEKEYNVTLPFGSNWSALVGFHGRNVFDVWNSSKYEDYIDDLSFPKAQVLNPNTSKIKKKSLATYFGICLTLDLSEIRLKYECDSTSFFQIQVKNFAHYEDVVTAFRVNVHSPLESNRHQVVREGTEVHFGSKVNLIVSYQKITFLNTKSAPCLAAKPYERCIDECFDGWLTQGLSCRMPYMGGDLPYCKDRSTTIAADVQGSKLETPIKCPQCHRKCVTDNFFTIMTPYDTGHNSTTIRLYYEENLFPVYEEVYSYTLENFISDQGSIFGLFLGFCIVNFLELVDRLWKKLFSLFRTLYKNRSSFNLAK